MYSPGSDNNNSSPLNNNNNTTSPSSNHQDDTNNHELPPNEAENESSSCSLKSIFCNPRCCFPLKTNAAFIVSLVFTAINLLFFLCLSVLLVMVSVDVLITLIVQCAIPPDYSFAFGGAAFICVIAPWVCVFVATVADYSRWPAKFFLLHYHFKVVLGVMDPVQPRISDASARGGYTQQQLAQTLSRENDEDRREILNRSYHQIVIHLMPFSIWAVSLLIGVLVGVEHESGTVFFLLAGVLFVLFITCFEYDVAPTAPLQTSLWTWRPSDASGMRHILLHRRKFDLSIICVASSLLTSCIVYAKDADALESGTIGFLLSIVTLALALFILCGLRVLVSLSADVDEMKKKSKNSLGSSSSGNLSGQNLSQSGGAMIGDSSPLLGGGGGSNVPSWVGSHRIGGGGGTAAAANSNTRVLYTQTPSDAESMASATGSFAFTNNNNDDKDDDAEKNSCCSSLLCEKLSTIFSRKFIYQHRDFALLASEIGIILVASTVLQVNAFKYTWPVWIIFIGITVCTIGLWFMQNRLTRVRAEQDMIDQNPIPSVAVRRMQATAEMNFRALDEETQLVFLYRSPSKPPEAVYRVSYFTVGFVAVVIVFVSLFSSTRSTYAAILNSTTTSTPFNHQDHHHRHHRSQFQKYAICSTLFPGDFYITDLAALLSVSQMKDKQASLETYFPTPSPSNNNNSFATILNEREGFSEENIIMVPKSFIALNYFQIRFPKRNTTIIVSTGAFTGFEALQTLYLLSDAVSLQFAIMLVPLPFADRLLSSMIRVVSIFKFGTRDLPVHLETKVHNIHRMYPDENILMLGFDVGGFVTSIAAARLNDDRVNSVTLAPINSGFQRKRFEFNAMNGDRHCASVTAEDDVLAKFDESLGMRQQIQSIEDCVLQNSFCHDLSLMMNSLSENCLDPMKRRADLV